MAKDVWVVVASNVGVKIFRAENNNKLTEVEFFEHPEGRLYNRDINTDKPGRSYSSVGPGRSALENEVSPKTQQTHSFAKAIVDYLEKARTNNQLSKIYLSAPPTLLGILRQYIKDPLALIIHQEINKDLLNLKPEEIREHLPYVL